MSQQSNGLSVFICKRGQPDIVKVQLELTKETLEKYKAKAVGTQYTPKQIMENMLRNWVDGVEGK